MRGVVDYANAGYIEQGEAAGMERRPRFEYPRDRANFQHWLKAPWIRSKTVTRDLRPFKRIVFKMRTGEHALWFEVTYDQIQAAWNWRDELAQILRHLRRVFRRDREKRRPGDEPY